MKVRIVLTILLFCTFILSGCVPTSSNTETTDDMFIDHPTSDSTTTEPKLRLTINGVPCDVIWENNETVTEMFSYAQNRLITVNTTIYGDFEQVGSLPKSFSRNDTKITTQPGDIVLYSGNQLVVFFGSNSWSYTKLGHINLSADELSKLLSGDTATIEIAVK